MTKPLLRHLRANAVAYLALSFALAGTSYAAVTLPASSVGARQLRNGAVVTRKLANGAVTAKKLDPRLIGGVVRHWAQIAADGRITSSSSPARNNGIAPDGNYVLSWKDTFSGRCIALATDHATGGALSGSSGYANTSIAGRAPTVVVVNTYNAQGQPSPTAFSVAVIC
jgi:hypothetical protein